MKNFFKNIFSFILSLSFVGSIAFAQAELSAKKVASDLSQSFIKDGVLASLQSQPNIFGEYSYHVTCDFNNSEVQVKKDEYGNWRNFETITTCGGYRITAGGTLGDGESAGSVESYKVEIIKHQSEG